MPGIVEIATPSNELTIYLNGATDSTSAAASIRKTPCANNNNKAYK